jgi:hypothetical protein
VEQWRGKITIVGVEQLGGVVIIIDDEQCFLVMLRLKDLWWSCNSKCDPNLHAILHIEMIILQICYCKH